MSLTDEDIIRFTEAAEAEEKEAERHRKRVAEKKKTEGHGYFVKGGRPGPGRPKGRKTDPKKRKKRRAEFDLLKADQNNLKALRDCAREGDMQKVYDRLLKDALDGKVKAQETYLKWMVGIPPKVTQVQHVNVTDLIMGVVKQRERLEDQEQYVDAEYSEVSNGKHD